MKNLLLLAALGLFILPATALADVITFNTPTTAGNTNTNTDNLNELDYVGGANQFDLDHHRAYTWQINGINLGGKQILSATITLKNIANWDTTVNKLFVHLLNSANTFPTATGVRSATLNGVTYFEDATGVPVPGDQIVDYFASANVLGPSGTDDTKLFEKGFNMVGQGVSTNFAGPGTYVAQNYTYTLNTAQLAALAIYISAGNNIAFGFDPDCHYWNNGLTFQITTGPTATPEPATLALLGTGLMSTGFYLRRRRRANKG